MAACVICYEEDNEIAPVFCCPATVCVFCNIILTACVYCRTNKPLVWGDDDNGSDMDLDLSDSSDSESDDTENAHDNDGNGGFYFDSTHPHLAQNEDGNVAYC